MAMQWYGHYTWRQFNPKLLLKKTFYKSALSNTFAKSESGRNVIKLMAVLEPRTPDYWIMNKEKCTRCGGGAA